MKKVMSTIVAALVAVSFSAVVFVTDASARIVDVEEYTRQQEVLNDLEEIVEQQIETVEILSQEALLELIEEEMLYTWLDNQPEDEEEE